jgi:hypothetical protein
VATAAGDDGVGAAGLDAVRRETVVARRNGAGARVPALERSEYGVAVDGVGGRRAAWLAERSRAL